MMDFSCDVCRRPIETKDGALHEQGEHDAIDGVVGFAFYRWNDEGARAEGMGHVHKRCIWKQATKYLKTLKWGRIEIPGGRSIIVNRSSKRQRSRAAAA